MGRRLYACVWYSSALLFNILYRTRIKQEDRERIPRGSIIASNHVTFLDAFFIASVLKRRVHFIMKDFPVGKKRLSETFMGKFTNSLEQIFLNGENITKDISRRCIEVIESGDYLGIFPESQRSYDGEILELNPGGVKLARLTKACVVPVYLQGAYDIWPRNIRYPNLHGDINIRVGKILEPSSQSRNINLFMRELKRELEGLRYKN